MIEPTCIDTTRHAERTHRTEGYKGRTRASTEEEDGCVWEERPNRQDTSRLEQTRPQLLAYTL